MIATRYHWARDIELPCYYKESVPLRMIELTVVLTVFKERGKECLYSSQSTEIFSNSIVAEVHAYLQGGNRDNFLSLDGLDLPIHRA
jgi:hypothetical protein